MKGLQKIIWYLREYLAKEFVAGMYLSLALFLALAIVFNYSVNFESRILGNQLGKPGFFWMNMAYYAVPYLVGCLAVSLFTRNFSYFKKPGFWLVLGVFCFALSGDAFYNWYQLFDVPAELGYLTTKLTAKVFRVAFYLIPLLLYFLFVKKRRGGFFGLTTRGFDSRPYLFMMLVMTPLLIWASFQPSFLRAYPTYVFGMAERYLGVGHWVTFVPYELFYALTFMALEILFRGFLIFEMEKYLGEKVVIPMVVVYCTLHFGKPLMECISSIFGGFLLGVIALRTRSVYGGIWVHIFIAVGMDLLAFVQEEYSWASGKL
ncbi:hypothetical protein GC194_08980 [bacterium]|nr:hypothetical protein [bacterium]